MFTYFVYFSFLLLISILFSLYTNCLAYIFISECLKKEDIFRLVRKIVF